MSSFTVIGLLLALVLCTKHANATPVMQDTTASSIIIKNSSNENQMENFLYNTAADTTESSDSNGISNQPIIEKSTAKPQNERPAQRRRRRPRHRKSSVNHSQTIDCRTTTERPAIVTKPTKYQMFVEFPGIFISHGWGPGR